jgi:Tol biopolymer transport system component
MGRGNLGNLEYAVAVMNADDNARVILTHQGSAEDPIWSPDGSKIAFTRIDDPATSDFEVFVMDPDGGGLTDISNGHASFDGDPSWSSR